MIAVRSPTLSLTSSTNTSPLPSGNLRIEDQYVELVDVDQFPCFAKGASADNLIPGIAKIGNKLLSICHVAIEDKCSYIHVPPLHTLAEIPVRDSA